MQISRINPACNNFRGTKSSNKTNWTKLTGYSSLGLGLGSIVAAKTNHFNTHKQLGLLSAAFALAHVGIILAMHYKYAKSKNFD